MNILLDDVNFWVGLVIVLKNYKIIKTQKDFIRFLECKRAGDPPVKRVLKFLKDNNICEINKKQMPYLYTIDNKKLFKILKTFKYQESIVETMTEPGVYR